MRVPAGASSTNGTGRTGRTGASLSWRHLSSSLTALPHRPARVDVVLALIVFVHGVVELSLAGAGGDLHRGGVTVQGAYLVGIAVAVLLRTVSPEWSAGTYLLSTVTVCVLSQPFELLAVGLAFTVLPFLYAISLDGARFGVVLGTLLVAIAVRSLDDPGQDWFAKVLDQVWALQSAGAGLVVRRYRRRADRLGAGAAERARDAVELERARIARELHDVVGHQVTAMIVTADAARGALEDALDRVGAPQQRSAAHGRPVAAPHEASTDEVPAEKAAVPVIAAAATIDALAAIEATGRQCLAEMRQLVGLLRQGLDGAPGAGAPGDDGPPAPPGGLDMLDDLFRRTRVAGLPVRSETVGTPRAVSTATGLAVYRVVQEALTNSLRHAGPAQASVTLQWTDATLTVVVEDSGSGLVGNDPGDDDTGATGFGAGLVGLQERVRLFGGTFSAGPTTPELPVRGEEDANGRGWVVRARFPLPPQTPIPRRLPAPDRGAEADA